MKTIKTYICEKCGEQFFTENECENHENKCHCKQCFKVKKLICFVNLGLGTYNHTVIIDNIYPSNEHDCNEYTSVISDQKMYIYEFGKIYEDDNELLNNMERKYICYTTNCDDEEFQKNLFDKMHKIIIEEVNCIKRNLDTIIQSEEFKQCKCCSYASYQIHDINIHDYTIEGTEIKAE